MQHYDHLLQHFLSRDELRPAITQPNTIDGIVYATDAYHAVAIPATKLEKEYPCHEKVPPIKTAWPGADRTFNKPIRIDPEELQMALRQVPTEKVYQYDPCDKCDGDGTIYCKHCKHSHECCKCNGRGEIKGAIIGEQPVDSPVICFGHAVFASARLLLNLVRCVEATGQPLYWLTDPQPDKQMLFRTGDIEVLICPRHVNSQYLEPGDALHIPSSNPQPVSA